MKISLVGRCVAVGSAALALTAGLALAHDMFLKPASYFVAPGAPISSVLLNGTFDRSSNSIDRKRLLDVSVVSPAGRARVDTSAWDARGDTSRVSVPTGRAGTYVLGVSTEATSIELDAKDFNEYLELDGLPDELARRKKAGELAVDAHERYAKHVKSVVQVGEARTEGYATVLGYPAEIVPLENPYVLARGGTLRVRILVDGKPVAGQHVVFGARTPSGGTVAERGTRTGPDGVASVPVTAPGVWYVKFIHMRKLAPSADGVTHESKWATLTFAAR